MKTSLIAACAAALSLAGCHKANQTPSKTVPTPVAVAPAPTPVAKPAPPPPPPAVATPKPETPQDPVALPHEHRGSVDHLARARDLRDEGDLDGALTEARRAVYDNPDDEDALDLASRLAKQTHQTDVAVEAFERLGQIRSEDPLPLIQEARLLVEKGDDDGAIEVAQEAIVRDGDNAEAWQVRGRAHLDKGELQPAIECFKKVIEIDPSHGYALNNLGFALLRANRNDEAVDALTQAAELLPDTAYVQNNLGVALERLGKIEEAKVAYDKATSLSLKYVKARINLDRVNKLASAHTGTVTDTGKPVPPPSVQAPPAPIPSELDEE